MKAPLKAKPRNVISNNTITMERFVVDQHMADAVRALAGAAEANAHAIHEVALRLAGPPNVGISVSG